MVSGRRMMGPARYLVRILPPLLATSVGLFIIGPWLNAQSEIDTPFHDEQSGHENDANGITATDNPDGAISSGIPVKPSGNVIRILSWTTDNITLWKPGLQGFDFCKLPDGKTCENVNQRSEYNTSEVILFHGQGINPDFLPAYRFPYHKWLFYEIETPPQTWIQRESLLPIRRVFNLTTTITMDSHIPMIERHRTCYVNEKKWPEFKNINYANGKTRKVAWFVSHCHTQSKRELYAEELAKYIPVDVWGKCGNYSCGSKYSRGDCDKTVLDKDYKFYLSFENSICEGYVTEKLWRLLLQPISAIPIVMGSIDYKAHIPDKTYLDVKDFKSPKELAEFLWKLDKDDDLFNEYIAKKNAVFCKHPGGKWFHEVRHECVLCQYLHDHRHEVSSVPDVLDFWSLDRRCTAAKDYLQGSFHSDKL